MYASPHHFFLALAEVRKATRRGDVAAAERWMKIAERHTQISQRLAALIATERAANAPRRPVRD